MSQGKDNLSSAPRPSTQCLPNGSDFDFGASPHHHHHHHHHHVAGTGFKPISRASSALANPVPFGGPNMAMPRPSFPLPPRNHLPAFILNQIDYYFSDANLVKDWFLRSNMDDQGFVPITLIADFPRVKNLKESIPYILNCLRCSEIVEIQGEKIRRRDGWKRWILNPSMVVSIDQHTRRFAG